MRRHRWCAVVAAPVLALTLVACGGGDDDDAAAPEPESTQTTPTGPPEQPQGADGVTWEIQNWDEHAEDEAVLAWKQFNEAVAGSINSGELLTAARDLSARDVLDPYVASMEAAWQDDLVVRPLAFVKIEASEPTDDGTRLVACVWDPSAVFYRADGEALGTVTEQWSREIVTLEQQDGAFVLTDVAYDGTCEGGDPT